ncbi:hypothetical protein IWQ61_008641 [Dispira simplex]|nr:hypothetical protein IWQ61_008641 [Dispira simplex]
MSLTHHDTNVLDMIFNGGGDLTASGLDEGCQPYPLPQDYDPNLSPLPTDLITALKGKEVDGVRLAEQDDLEGAHQVFTKIIHTCETYASAYNNRAQVYRLQGHLDLAFADLAQAIRYSRGDSTVLKQAYSQRGIIRKAQGDSEGAFADLELGGKYGNPLAKEAAVYENPYAKLCNAIMKESLGKLYTPSE